MGYTYYNKKKIDYNLLNQIKRKIYPGAVYIIVMFLSAFVYGCGDGSNSTQVQTGFMWTVSPSERYVIQGDDAHYTVAVSLISGMPAPPVITLNEKDLPAGLSASFSPNPLFLPADSLVSIKTSSGTSSGNYTISIKNNLSEDILQTNLYVAPFEWISVNALNVGPSALENHSGVYDSVNDKLIVFGGETNGGSLADVWVLSNVTSTGKTPVWQAWKKMTTFGSPIARSGHKAVYNQEKGCMIIFGGKDSSGELIKINSGNRLWVLKDVNGKDGQPVWEPLTENTDTGKSPVDRAGFSSVYDSTNNRMIVYGGADLSSGKTTLLNDVWVLTNADGSDTQVPPKWENITPSETGNVPAARVNHTAVYDLSTNRMIVMGGETSKGVSSSVWILNYANGLGGAPSWTPLNISGGPVPARKSHTAIYDSASNRITVFGGIDSTGKLLDDIWVLSAANGEGEEQASWIKKVNFHTSKIPYPVARYNHIAIGNTETKKMVVFGGLTDKVDSAYLDDIWILNHADGE